MPLSPGGSPRSSWFTHRSRSTSGIERDVTGRWGAGRVAFWFALGAMTLGGCGAGGGDGADADGAGNAGTGANNLQACSIGPTREWLDASMRDYYLFADRVPRPRLTDHDTDESLLAALRVDPPDRYSYLADEQTYDTLFEEGETFGFGWRFVRVDADTLLFAHVMSGSPVARAGIVRGERLVSIDGTPLDAFLSLPTAERDERLGVPDTPTTLVLGVETPGGVQREVTVRSERFRVVTVEDVDIAEHAGTRIGYLHFTSFLETSLPELDSAFDTFAAAGIGELVLDLRHNGGGRVDVAAELAGGIGGTALASETFAHFRYNPRYAAFDQSFGFGQRLAALDLARVFVLSGEGTCSASELVINGLAPFIDVVTIGQPSCGKPYGTLPERRCGRVLNALRVSFENAAGVGDYVDGLAPDCVVDENPRTALGRPGDPLYESALDVVANGTCGLVAARSSVLADAPVTGIDTLIMPDPLFRDAILP